ncbi:MAG: hypothetical protein WEB06_04030 [Actinomycetota bacterium]
MPKRAAPKPKRAAPKPKRSSPKAAAAKRPGPRRAAPKPAKLKRSERRATPKRATPKRATASSRSKTRRAEPKRSTTRRTTPRRSTTRPRSRVRRLEAPEAFVPAPIEPESRPDEEAWPDEPEFQPAIRGEVAVAGVPASGEPVAPWETDRQPEFHLAKEVYREDIPIAIVSAVLAASTFMPWYKGQGALDVGISAWSSGTWGPIMFFLGVGSLLLIILRRAGVRLSLPFEEALLHELAGWVALAGGVIKSRYRPGAEGLLGVSWGLWVGLGAAFLLAFLAGRMSPHAPLVRRPKWYRQKGGALAALLLLVVIAGAAVFGTMNSASLTGAPIDSGDLPGLVRGRLPTCAGAFPLPEIVKPVQGVEQPCQAHLQSERSAEEVVAAMKDTLERAGWSVGVGESGTTSTLTLTKPQCATVAVIEADQGSVALVAFGICATPSPSPS